MTFEPVYNDGGEVTPDTFSDTLDVKKVETLTARDFKRLSLQRNLEQMGRVTCLSGRV